MPQQSGPKSEGATVPISVGEELGPHPTSPGRPRHTFIQVVSPIQPFGTTDMGQNWVWEEGAVPPF